MGDWLGDRNVRGSGNVQNPNSLKRKRQEPTYGLVEIIQMSHSSLHQCKYQHEYVLYFLVAACTYSNFIGGSRSYKLTPFLYLRVGVGIKHLHLFDKTRG